MREYVVGFLGGYGLGIFLTRDDESVAGTSSYSGLVILALLVDLAIHLLCGFQPLFSMPRGFALLYPAAPPSVFAYFIGSYTALAVALGREYVVELQGVLSGFLST